MVKNMSYSTISNALDSWEVARRKRGGDKAVGKEILLTLFQMEPRTKQIFGFDLNEDIEGQDAKLNLALHHGERLVQMFDGVLTLLGPNGDTLDEIVEQLGERHKRYGVQPGDFILMGIAFCKALSNILGGQWKDSTKAAWEEIFAELTAAISMPMQSP
jgi:methyl-accepting chemotaxis protein